jgi:restriction system protein
MARKNERLGELLVKAPWWVSVGVGFLLFAVLRWVAPALLAGNSLGNVLAQALPRIAPHVLGLFLVLAVISFMFGRRRARLVDQQTDLESLRAATWKELEYLVAEIFQRKGHEVEFNTGGGADGGVDVTLRKDGRTTLVQCKQWRSWKVGAPVVRELLGAVAAQNADAGIVITTGVFTREAVEFARGKSIELIDGPTLLELVRTVQANPAPVAAQASPARSAATTLSEPSVTTPTCPECGTPMVKRLAKRGTNAGQEFWGCPRYPGCRGTRQI